MAANARPIMTHTLRTFPQVSITTALPETITLPKKIMNDLPTLPDWIDDILDDDSPEYDDQILETIEESYQGDYE